MFAVGLTGGIGSGKSTVADLFAKRGVTLVDTDVIAHRITAPQGLAMPSIATAFGPSFVAEDGSLDRARMRALVFSDENARKRLEAITHPLIRAETERQRQQAPGPYVIVVVPLLVESGSWKTRAGRRLQRRNPDRSRHASQRFHSRAGTRDHRAPGHARSAPCRRRRRNRQRQPIARRTRR